MSTTTNKPSGKCCDAKVVKVAGQKLTTTCEKGDEHDYTVAQDAKVTRDGKESKLTDIPKGSTVRLTTASDDKTKVLAIDSGKHIPALATTA